jgi:antirestriction protein ArdC
MRTPLPVTSTVVAARIEAAETFSAQTRAVILYGGNRTFYAAAPDDIQPPTFERLRDPESYYAILLHELTQWTRHQTHLARDFGRKR